jgi:hypothetical protein
MLKKEMEVKMKYIFYLMVLIVILLIFSGCDARDPSKTGYIITLASDLDTLQVGDAINSASLTAFVMNDNGESMSDVNVHFETDMGSVLNNVLTDVDGYAHGTFWYNGTTTGTAKIRASYSGSEAEINIYIIDANPYILEVTADPGTIYLGSGVTSSQIQAHLTDRNGVPLANARIEFSTEEGFVPSEAYTNASGYANVQFLFEPGEEMMIEITATYENATAFVSINIIMSDIVKIEIWADQDTVYAGTNNNYTDVMRN